MSNLKNYKKQASKLLSFSGKNPAQIKFNSKWLSPMNFEKVISLASQMTVQQMLERDMFDKRIKEGKPIFIHEDDNYMINGIVKNVVKTSAFKELSAMQDAAGKDALNVLGSMSQDEASYYRNLK
jgi:hypothetical protein